MTQTLSSSDPFFLTTACGNQYDGHAQCDCDMCFEAFDSVIESATNSSIDDNRWVESITCVFCGIINCTTHLCQQCFLYKVVPINAPNDVDYQCCEKHGELLYQANCGIIYDGYSQCPCYECQIFDDDDLSMESDDEETCDPEN